MKYADLLEPIAEVHLLLRRFGASYMFTSRALVVLHVHDLRCKLVAAGLPPCAAIGEFLDLELPGYALSIEVVVNKAKMDKPDFVQHIKNDGFTFSTKFPSGAQRYHMPRLPTENHLVAVDFVPEPGVTSTSLADHITLAYGNSDRQIPTSLLPDRVEILTSHMVGAYEDDTTPLLPDLEDLRMLALAQDHVEQLHRPAMFGLGAAAWKKEVPAVMDDGQYAETANALRQAVSQEPGQLAQWNADAETLALGSDRQEVLMKEWNDALNLLVKRFSEPYDVANMRLREHIVRNRRSFPDIRARVLARR